MTHKSRIAFGMAAAALLAAGCATLTGNVPAPTAADQAWRLPATYPMPADNVTTPARVELGKVLFFDHRISDSGAMSCASCHLPHMQWTDGRKLPILPNGDVLPRHSPTIVNIAYNTQFMWDGRKKSLEDQAIGPHRHLSKAAFAAAAQRVAGMREYQDLFAEAYPGEPVNEETIAKAMSVFQRSVISNDSPFDRWVAGDTSAITPQQYRGYKVFLDPAKGNCASCHNGPNFTDNGFHNIGIKTADGAKPDLGRFNIRQVAAMKGAFKTPTLRDVEFGAPYYHDGSAETLRDVVDHYARGGDDRSNVSPEVRKLDLTEQDKEDLIAFMRALSGRQSAFVPPKLPLR
ncbi:cytochrome-c peroxidase [Ramlibacter pallidus]|uniref:Tryptophan tryptophylquinone biosynthesis enzyme MauG n=1 Tax=Ramlibacter pallidus TaxID=2780087 RepID=A0ABR9S0N0_9BURK|nr:cytochrome c peroxidase [Ramlibacter pallidus]MBE7367004.1 tryptophan tryptophylquinone biosynthesis enzyme MauG [Ramlibacter pallidus]